MNLIERKMKEWKGVEGKLQPRDIRLIYDTVVGPPGLKNGDYRYSPNGHLYACSTPQSDFGHFSKQPKKMQERITEALDRGLESGLLVVSFHGTIGSGFRREYALSHVMADEIREYLGARDELAGEAKGQRKTYSALAGYDFAGKRARKQLGSFHDFIKGTALEKKLRPRKEKR
jgi:hypothetical protein